MKPNEDQKRLSDQNMDKRHPSVQDLELKSGLFESSPDALNDPAQMMGFTSSSQEPSPASPSASIRQEAGP